MVSFDFTEDSPIVQISLSSEFKINVICEDCKEAKAYEMYREKDGEITIYAEPCFCGRKK